LDDQKDITTAVKSGLSLRGYKVDAFNDPILCLEKFEPDKYDVIITDIRMPTMNGFEFYRRVAEMDNKVKVFFLSAIDVYEQEVRLAFPNLPSNCFITKPVTLDRLVQLISN
jgi:two-component system C4-dicarboxylate transport response regulator DctD